jgi:hypothetical protein
MGKKYELIETKLMWLFSNELATKIRKESKAKKERNQKPTNQKKMDR